MVEQLVGYFSTTVWQDKETLKCFIRVLSPPQVNPNRKGNFNQRGCTLECDARQVVSVLYSSCLPHRTPCPFALFCSLQSHCFQRLAMSGLHLPMEMCDLITSFTGPPHRPSFMGSKTYRTQEPRLEFLFFSLRNHIKSLLQSGFLQCFLFLVFFPPKAYF